MIIISVVRDCSMYDRLVRFNHNNAGARFVCYDNNIENKTIPVRYNDFLDSYDYSKEDWFVFCHEDYEFFEPLSEKISLMDEGCIYGVIGSRLGVPGIGLQLCSNKDGSKINFVGKAVKKPSVVDTIDCLCLIVHSSLVDRHKLRFDENLTYDLYTEDFCISSFERFGVVTKVLPIRGHHYSYGNVLPRFYEQLEYLNEKYANASRVYVTTTAVAIGKREGLEKVKYWLRTGRRIPPKWLFYKKITHRGRVIVKVFGIPIWGMRKYTVESYRRGNYLSRR